MTIWLLEMRNTENWDDVRYRRYTSSRARMEKFRTVPKIKFTDSGHGIVPTVSEHPLGHRRQINVSTVDAWVDNHMGKK